MCVLLMWVMMVNFRKIYFTFKHLNICLKCWQLSLQDGKAMSATVAASFMCFCHLFDDAASALNLFTVRRQVPGITPSQSR